MGAHFYCDPFDNFQDRVVEMNLLLEIHENRSCRLFDFSDSGKFRLPGFSFFLIYYELLTYIM